MDRPVPLATPLGVVPGYRHDPGSRRDPRKLPEILRRSPELGCKLYDLLSVEFVPRRPREPCCLFACQDNLQVKEEALRHAQELGLFRIDPGTVRGRRCKSPALRWSGFGHSTAFDEL